jgi:hypothetical protein
VQVVLLVLPVVLLVLLLVLLVALSAQRVVLVAWVQQTQPQQQRALACWGIFWDPARSQVLLFPSAAQIPDKQAWQLVPKGAVAAAPHHQPLLLLVPVLAQTLLLGQQQLQQGQGCWGTSWHHSTYSGLLVLFSPTCSKQPKWCNPMPCRLQKSYSHTYSKPRWLCSHTYSKPRKLCSHTYSKPRIW